MCTNVPMESIGDHYETPRHSNLLRSKKFVLPNNFGSRGRLDWNNYDTVSVSRAYVVRRAVLLCLFRHPDIRTCRDGKKFVLLNNFVFGVCSICKTTTTCHCNMHVMSDLMHIEAWCDTHTFKLGCGEKICPAEQFCIRGVFDLQDYDTLWVSCEFAVPCCESGAMIRPPVIRTCLDAKNCVAEQFLIQRWVGLEQLRYPVSNTCMCGKTRCIALPV